MTCQDCGEETSEEEVVIYSESGGSKIIGYYKYCINKDCDFQEG